MYDGQLSFAYQGEQYVTLFGASDFLKGAGEKNGLKNAASAKTVAGNNGYFTAFKRLAGSSTRDVPKIDTDSVSLCEGVFTVVGAVELDGVVRDIFIDEDGIHFDDETDESPTEEVEDTFAGVGVEFSEGEMSVEEEMVVSGENTEVTEEEVEELPKPADTVETQPQVIPNRTDRFNPFARFEGLPVPTRGGIAFDKEGNECTEEMLVGGATNNEVGVYWDEQPYPSNFERVQKRLLEKAAEDTTERITKPASGVQFVAPSNSVQVAKRRRDNELIQPKAPVENKPKVETPKPAEVPKSMSVEPKTPQPKSTEEVLSNMGFKNTQRAPERIKAVDQPTGASRSEISKDWDKDIVKQLKQIPDYLMRADITAFTTKPVDMTQLEERGSLYCVDNRWHRNGAWYCIDVVDEASRCFFNSKSKLIAMIPFKYCKEWANSTP